MQKSQETWVQSLGWEGPLEEEMETHSSILVWKIPWVEEPGRLQSQGLKESDKTEHSTVAFGSSWEGSVPSRDERMVMARA